VDDQSTAEMIEPGRVYSKAEVSRRLRLGVKGWESLRQAGLQTIRIGRGSFVFSDDVIAALRRQQQEATPCER
jgi:hypothetical protein